MQFNSFIFILLLLPLSCAAYYVGNRINNLVGKLVIIIASLIFYVYYDWKVFIPLGISIVINYVFTVLIKRIHKWNKLYMIIPIIINVCLLLYFKYTNFVLDNVNTLFNLQIELKELIMPIGISFFTFQQIAYVVAIYREELKDNSIIDYIAYILYFPKILMGPLADPVDFIGQLNNEDNKKINVDNMTYGIKLFSFGLFKKVMIADVFANAVAWGYSNFDAATSVEWLLVMLFYTFEIYFDFSGYSDMATGTSLMFNITLPINFDSPYKAISVRDFWKRWHISLTQFFTKYIYIPLGGSRKGKIITYVNTMIVFLISGIWHGANWTFILWGCIYGLFMIYDRAFDGFMEKIVKPIRWFITFVVINVLWLLFRSNSVSEWFDILKRIIRFNDTNINDGIINAFILPESQFIRNTLHIGFLTDNVKGFWMIVYIVGALVITLIPNNNYRNYKKLSAVSMILAAIAFIWGFICLSSESVFVYFNF